MRRINRPIGDNQQGLVSILVSVTFVIILSLITTSFAVLMRREQRQALDRQLSTQAFYAAESGINDAVDWIKKGGSENVTDCDSDIFNGKKDLGGGISYSCLLVNNSVDSLEYAVGTDNSTITRLSASENIDKIKISWQESGGSNNFAPPGQQFFPQESSGTGNEVRDVGILRLAITPIGSNVSRQTLIDQTQTLFLYPNKTANAGESVSYGYETSSSSKGQIIDSKCNAGNTQPYHCNLEITGLGGFNSKNFYIRLKSIYQESSVSISAENASSKRLKLKGSQAMIDTTGRANDVLRRIQVRIPITESYDYPEFTLESADDICKRLEVFPNSNKINNNCVTSSP